MGHTVESLRQSLAALSLDTRGHKDVLARRLARASLRAAAPPPPSAPPQPATRPPGEHYDSFLVFDVEATCERIEGAYGKLAFAYPNEIIELPVILVQWRKVAAQEGREEQGDPEWSLQVIDEFQSYVRPTWRPTLSAFCTELTGITQADVDDAPTYAEVLTLFRDDFIRKHNLFTRDNKTVWVTDGPWDLRDFIAKASYISGVPRPAWLSGLIIDLRLLATTFFGTQPAPSAASPRVPAHPMSPSELSLSSLSLGDPDPTSSPLSSDLTLPPPIPPTTTPSAPVKPPPSLSIPFVLSALSLAPFEGRLHSGLCDARNAARILIELQRRGVELEGNRTVPNGGKERRWEWMGRSGAVEWDKVERRARKLAL